MKIAFVMPTYFDASSAIAGGERYAYGLAKAMSERAETSIFTFGEQDKIVHDDKLKIVYCKTLFRIGGLANPVSFSHLKALPGFDIIHCLQFKTLVTEFSILLGTICHKKVFATDLAGGTCYSLARLFPMQKGVKEFLFISEYNRHLNSDLEAPSRVIFGGVNIKFFSPINEPSRKSFLYVGRIFKKKGIHDLIEALPENASLDIVGQCYDFGYLEELKKMGHKKKVSFYDSLPDDEVLNKYRNALALVLPSLADGGFTSAMEAMACGTPVIGTHLGSLPEVVAEGETGFLVNPGDVKALREKMHFISENLNAAQTLGQNACRRVLAQFTWEKVVDRCLEAYAA